MPSAKDKAIAVVCAITGVCILVLGCGFGLGFGIPTILDSNHVTSLPRGKLLFKSYPNTTVNEDLSKWSDQYNYVYIITQAEMKPFKFDVEVKYPPCIKYPCNYAVKQIRDYEATLTEDKIGYIDLSNPVFGNTYRAFTEFQNAGHGWGGIAAAIICFFIGICMTGCGFWLLGVCR